MQGINLNKLHRYAGLCLSPFLIVQTLSGLLLDFGLFRRGTPAPGAAGGVLDTFLVKAHFGPGIVNDGYHILLGMAILWMAVSGWMLYLRMRRARKRMLKGSPPGTGK